MSRAIIVVPCYNEAKRLDLVAMQDFARRTHAVELLLVNDGSGDNTLEMIERLHAGNPRRFSFLHLARNSGKAEAVRQGLLLALTSRPDYVGFWDADLATPLSDIEPFCRVLDHKPRIEAVIGTRMCLLGHQIERRPLRYWLGRLFANTASLALRARIFDTQCGAKVFRVTPHLEHVLAQPFLARWIFDVELFARLQQLRRADGFLPLAEAIYEFPLDAWREVGGSTIRSGDFLKAPAEMAKIYWTYLRPGLRPAVRLPLPLPQSSAPSSRPGKQQAA